MKIVSKLTLLVAALAIPVIALGSVVFAAAEGQVEGGDIYRIKNETKNIDFSDPQAAGPCENLTYKVRVHNPGPSPLSQVYVKVNLPNSKATTNVSTVTVSSQNADPSSTSDSATLKLSQALKVNYVPGSSQLLDANGSYIQSIADVTSGNAVNIGNVGVSIQQKRFVQFKAKTDCAKPPCEENPNAPGCNPCKDNPNLPQCHPCKENPNKPGCKPCKDNPNLPECKPCKHNPDLPQCKPNPPCENNPSSPECVPQCEDDMSTPEDECNPVTPQAPGNPQTPGTPGALPDTGPGEVAAIFSIVSIAGTLGYRVFIRRLGVDA